MVTKKKIQGISELNRRNVEAAMKLARLSMENSQQVLSLHAELAKGIFESTVANAKAHAAVRSPQDLVKLNTEYVQETARRLVEVAKKVAAIANDSRGEFSRVLTEQLAASKSELTVALQGLVKNLPAGVPDVKKSVDQAIAAANAAFEQLSKVSAGALSTLGAGKAKAAAKKPAAKKAAAKPAAKKAAAKPAVKKAVAKPAAKPVAKPAAKKPVAKKPVVKAAAAPVVVAPTTSTN